MHARVGATHSLKIKEIHVIAATPFLVVFVLVPLWGLFSPGCQTVASRTRATATSMKALCVRLDTFAQACSRSGSSPPLPDQVSISRACLTVTGTRPRMWRDAWNRDFLVETAGLGVWLRSLGPDGLQRSADDIVVNCDSLATVAAEGDS